MANYVGHQLVRIPPSIFFSSLSPNWRLFLLSSICGGQRILGSSSSSCRYSRVYCYIAMHCLHLLNNYRNSLLIEKGNCDSVIVETFQLLFMCTFHSETSSFIGRSFHSLFLFFCPYFGTFLST